MNGDLDDAGGGSGGLLRPTPLSNPPVDKLGGGVLKVFLYYTPRMTTAKNWYPSAQSLFGPRLQCRLKEGSGRLGDLSNAKVTVK